MQTTVDQDAMEKKKKRDESMKDGRGGKDKDKEKEGLSRVNLDVSLPMMMMTIPHQRRGSHTLGSMGQRKQRNDSAEKDGSTHTRLGRAGRVQKKNKQDGG